MNAVLLKPLPFPDADEIVTLSHVPPPTAFPGLKTFSVSIANYLDWRKQNSVFASMSAWDPLALQIGGSSRPQALKVTISDAGSFDVLRVKPAFGRVFDESACQSGRDNVIVLSPAAAQEHFGSAASAVGKQLTLNNRTYHVIGVMPARFQVKSWFPEVALAIVLLIGAGLMVRSLLALQATQPGFDPVNVTMTVPMPKSQNDRDLNLFYNTFLPRVAALPGVESAAAIDSLPMLGGSEQPITVEARPAEVFALQQTFRSER